MADFMRRGPQGIRGVVVSPATAGGTPVNFDPHDMSKTSINVIDPDGKQLHNLALSQLTQDRVNAAIAAAAETVPGDDINSIRERAAMVFEELAKTAGNGVQRVPVKTTKQPKQPAPAPVTLPEDEEEIVQELREEVEQSVPLLEKIDRTYSPMAAFGLKKRAAAPAIAGGSPVSSSARVGPPQKLVYFEKEGIGTVPAFFHDIIVSVSLPDDDAIDESGFMVLIYDLRFEQNAARWFPPSNDPYQRPWAVQISDDSKLYLVHTTGFQYVYDHREYCILLVEKAVMAPGM
jgi:DNA-binding transcriptional regulator YiaG